MNYNVSHNTCKSYIDHNGWDEKWWVYLQRVSAIKVTTEKDV